MVSGVDAVIRAVGRNMAFETGIRVGLSMSARLLTGFLCGLPPTAISINAAVSFAASAVLEIPTGVAADMFGRTRSVRLGYLFQIAANLCTFFAIVVFPFWPAGMWLLLVSEGILDAAGNCFLSGAREASYQAIVENATEMMETRERAEARTRYLALAEAYGRPILVLFPMAAISATLLLHSQEGRGHYAMLLIVAGWIAIERQFEELVRLAPREARGAADNSWLSDARECLRLLGDTNLGLLRAIFCWLTDRFVFITVTCYVTLAVLKDPGLWPGANPAVPVVAITGLFLAGRVSRSFILPALSKGRSNDVMMSFGAAAQILLAGAVMLFPYRGGSAYVLFLAAAVGVYDVVSGLIERPALGTILDGIPERIRASFLSILSAAVLLAQFLYSLRLTALGTGVPSMSEIWLLALAGGVVMLLLSYEGVVRGFGGAWRSVAKAG